MNGSVDTDNIASAQSGTANTALTLNGSSVNATSSNGLVPNTSLGSAGNLAINGGQAGLAGSGLNSRVTITSSNDLSGVTFTITGTDIDGNALTENISGPESTTITTTNTFRTVTQISTNAAASSVEVGTLATFADASGTRASITSSGGDESSISFTVVGTDMSGNTQTEVIWSGNKCNCFRFKDL